MSARDKILEYFRKYPKYTYTVAEIAEHTNCADSTARSACKALCEDGYIDRVVPSYSVAAYRLGDGSRVSDIEEAQEALGDNAVLHVFAGKPGSKDMQDRWVTNRYWMIKGEYIMLLLDHLGITGPGTYEADGKPSLHFHDLESKSYRDHMQVLKDRKNYTIPLYRDSWSTGTTAAALFVTAGGDRFAVRKSWVSWLERIIPERGAWMKHKDKKAIAYIDDSTDEVLAVCVLSTLKEEEEAAPALSVDCPDCVARQGEQCRNLVDGKVKPTVHENREIRVRRPSSIPQLVRQYFQDNPDEVVLPGNLNRIIANKRNVETVSMGAIRSAINSLVDKGVVVRLPGSPLQYQLASSIETSMAEKAKALEALRQKLNAADDTEDEDEKASWVHSNNDFVIMQMRTTTDDEADPDEPVETIPLANAPGESISDWPKCRHSFTVCTECAESWSYDREIRFIDTPGGRALRRRIESAEALSDMAG